MAGGLVEYLSMLTGMRAIWAIVAVVYFLGWLGSRALQPGTHRTGARESSEPVGDSPHDGGPDTALASHEAD